MPHRVATGSFQTAAQIQHLVYDSVSPTAEMGHLCNPLETNMRPTRVDLTPITNGPPSNGAQTVWMKVNVGHICDSERLSHIILYRLS